MQNNRLDINEINRRRKVYKKRWKLTILMTLLNLLIYLIAIGLIIFIHYQLSESFLTFVDISSLLFWSIIILFVLNYFYHKRVKRWFNYSMKRKGYRLISQLQRYDEAEPIVCFHGIKYDKTVIALHGFTASPAEGKSLAKELRKLKINYIFPALSGFGIENIHTLNHTHWSNWVREIYDQVVIMKQCSKEVTLMGHSFGAIVALYVATILPVDKLILTSPYLSIGPTARKKFIKLFSMRYIRHFLSLLLPYLPKRENLITDDRFEHLLIPNKPFIQMHDLMNLINYNSIKCKEIHLLIGQKDSVINTHDILDRFKKANLDIHVITYANSRHDLYMEEDKEKVLKDIIHLIKT